MITSFTKNINIFLLYHPELDIKLKFMRMLYRQDPKVPNKKSFEKLSAKLNADDLETELACSKSEYCEFPFPNLDDYLKQRGLEHLRDFVLWKDEGKSKYRSKTYINLLKIRLRFHFPEKCSVIVRNEAHVRLASSSWYVSRLLRVCSIVGIIIFLVALHISLMQEQFPNLRYAFSYNLTAFLTPVIVLSIGEYIRSRIVKVLHYQRLREVFYVLETAYTAFRDKPELLKFPFNELYIEGAHKLQIEYNISMLQSHCSMRIL